MHTGRSGKTGTIPKSGRFMANLCKAMYATNNAARWVMAQSLELVPAEVDSVSAYGPEPRVDTKTSVSLTLYPEEALQSRIWCGIR